MSPMICGPVSPMICGPVSPMICGPVSPMIYESVLRLKCSQAKICFVSCDYDIVRKITD